MSKPIDQEREAFETAYKVVVDNGWANVKHMARQVWDQARAAVQPTGVAVPEAIAMAVKELRSMARESDDYAASNWTRYKLGGEQSAELSDLAQSHTERAKHLRALAEQLAAPHPVSGEQNMASVNIGVDTLKWWRQLIDLNPADLAPRLDAVIAAHRAQQGEQPS